MGQHYKTVPDCEALRYEGTPDKPDIKIFVSHRIDLDAQTIDNPIYVPVRCGAVYDVRENNTILGDDTGENISERRETFNEFTVLYWAWKNVTAKYYGLCHYRRYLIFRDTKLTPDPYGNVLFDTLNQNSALTCGLLNQREIEEQVLDNDFIISEPYDVTYRGFKNLREHYTEVPTQHIEDLDKAIDVIRELSPDYLDAAEEYFNGTLFYPCNLFVMKKEVFFQYCAWLFPILFELERRIDISNYDETEKRVVGFLGERLLGVFYVHYLKEHPEAKHKIVQRALFFQTEDCIGQQDFTFSIRNCVKRIVPRDSISYLLLKKIYKLLCKGEKNDT